MTLQGAAGMGAAKAKSEVNDARLRTHIHQLEAEVHQLNHEKLALQSCARASRDVPPRGLTHRAPPKSE